MTGQLAAALEAGAGTAAAVAAGTAAGVGAGTVAEAAGTVAAGTLGAAGVLVVEPVVAVVSSLGYPLQRSC